MYRTATDPPPTTTPPFTHSVAVILAPSETPSMVDMLANLPSAVRPLNSQYARGERAACVSVTIEHFADADLLAILRPWASRRGWQVTVAPIGGGR